MSRLFLGEIGAALAILAGVLYLHSVIVGKTRPHRLTWGVWALIGALGAGSAIQGGAGAGALVVSVYALTTASVFLLSLWPKFGKPGGTRPYDVWLGVFALAALILWRVGNLGATFAASAAVIADLFATLPTLREAWRQPEYEALLPWLLTAGAAILGVAAIDVFSYTSASYAVYVAAANTMIVLALLAGTLKE